MQDAYWKKAEDCLAKDRLAAFGQDDAGCRVILSRYLWNVAVCESVYVPLHFLEVGLRNSIHAAMCASVGQENWFESCDMTCWAQQEVKKAKEKIEGKNKPVTDGRVIAELQFGFWTSIFEPHYEGAPLYFLPSGIKKVFPLMPPPQLSRKEIKVRLDKVRRLRNRVFHHERIIHWTNLLDLYEYARDFISWMSPELAELTDMADTFPGVYSNGTQPFLDRLDERWQVQRDVCDLP